MSDWYQRRMARHRAEQQPFRPQPHTPVSRYYGTAPQARAALPQQPETPPQGMTNIQNLWMMMQQWRGGKAHKVDAEPCPECGSNQYYSRTGAEVRRGPPPAPHCYNCGYNGMFTQGLATSWQAT